MRTRKVVDYERSYPRSSVDPTISTRLDSVETDVAAKASLSAIGNANTMAIIGDSITALNGHATDDAGYPVTGLTTGVTSGGSVPVGTYWVTVVPAYSGNVTPASAGYGPPCQSVTVTTTSGNQTITASWTAPINIPASLSNVTYYLYISSNRDNFASPSLMGTTTSTSFSYSSATASAGTPAAYSPSPLGPVTWANILSGHRLKMIGNFGIGTQRAADIYGRINEVIALNPGIVVFKVGVNDVNSAGTETTIMSSITPAITALRNAGILVVLCTIDPSVNANTTSEQTELLKTNRAIRILAQTTPGVYLADTFRAVVDPSSATAQYISAMTSDGLHPSGQGAAYEGYVISQAIKAATRDIDRLSDTNGDILNGFFYLASNNDPMLKGSTGTPYTGLANFYASTFYTGGVTNVTFSIVATDDSHPGNWQRVALAAASSGTTNYIAIRPADLTLSLWSGVSAGDVIYAETEWRNPSNDWSNITRLELQLIPLDASSSNTLSPSSTDGGNITTGALPNTLMTSGRLRTPNIVVPNACTRFRVYSYFGGATQTAAGTVDFRRLAIKKVN